MNTIVETKTLSKTYGNDSNAVKALDSFNLTIREGEYVAIVGTSGSGKSTLLHMMGGLDVPSKGEIFIDGNSLSKMDEDTLTTFRRRNIGFVFQQYNLIQALNVRENIVLPAELEEKDPDPEYLDHICQELGIKDFMNKYPSQLSGGQQQRVAIARAMILKPRILLCDEPTGNLDKSTTKEVIELLKHTSESFHQTIIMITHDEEVAKSADRIVRIEDGHLLSDTEATR